MGKELVLGMRLCRRREPLEILISGNQWHSVAQSPLPPTGASRDSPAEARGAHSVAISGIISGTQ